MCSSDLLNPNGNKQESKRLFDAPKNVFQHPAREHDLSPVKKRNHIALGCKLPVERLQCVRPATVNTKLIDIQAIMPEARRIFREKATRLPLETMNE